VTDTFTNHFHTTPDGPRLHYRDYPAVGETTGVPVVCLHGLTRNVKDFEDLAPMIAALGRRVIVVSMRGRGRSDFDPQPERYQPLTYAIDLTGMLDALALEKVVFIGTSMGGLITMILASTMPERFAGAVINDIGPEISQIGLDRIMSNVSSRDPAASWGEAERRAKDANLETFPLRTDDQFWQDFARKTWIEMDDGRLRLDYDGAIIDQMGGGDPLPDLWPFFNALKEIPTLSVRGGITDLLTTETVAKMCAAKPDLATVNVPNVGHAPFLTEPEAWAEIKALLGRVA
jgi:pimeloyl-ACP methyl ester carboxylesterase